MLKNVIRLLMLVTVFAVFSVQPIKAAESSQPTEVEASSKIAISEVAPELYYQLRRYPKFYGDINTIHGGLLERSYLLDNLGGVRDTMVGHGLYLDVSVTQFLHGNVSGGTNTNSVRNEGTADYWLTLDTGKAGLWSGGALFLHAESSWQADKSISSDTGNLLPPNFDAAMPMPGENEGFTIPELYLVQALPANFAVIAGKVNFSGLGDTNIFANNERTQFSYTGLNNNPILGSFIPYTPLGVALAWNPSKEQGFTLLATQVKGDGTTSGFDNFDGDVTIGGQYQYSTVFNDKLPGHYLALVGYNSKDIPQYDVDPRHLIEEIIGVVPVADKSENYAFLVNFDQYLWVKEDADDAGRSKLPPVGIGIFGRAGWAPKDRNVIDQFYSFGVGGYGMLIPGRDNDRWGLGWAGTHISSDLRDDVGLLGIDIDSFEHAFEAFYNIEVTPAIHLTLNAQVIDSPAAVVDTATTVGSRLQVDF